MAVLTYTLDQSDHSYNSGIEVISIKISSDLSINEYLEVCKKLAIVIGYHPTTISEAFDNLLELSEN
jgi:hypothetical protein